MGDPAGSSDVWSFSGARIALHCEVCLVPRGLVRKWDWNQILGCGTALLPVGKVYCRSFFSFLVLSLILPAYARYAKMRDGTVAYGMVD
jgi:hypothetical protein